MANILENLVEVKKEDKNSLERVKKASTDFQFFCETYLPHYFTGEPAPYHGVIYDVINSASLKNENIQVLKKYIKKEYHCYLLEKLTINGIVDADPRGFGKSVRLSFAFPLWELLFKRKRFIMIIGASASAAEGNLNQIKTELEENELLIQDFGELVGDVWKSNYIELKNNTAMTAKGAGASMRGIKYKQHRPDLVILDDILKDEAAESQVQRDKIYNWVKRVIFPLARDIFLVFVNTIFHSDDIVCRLLDEIKTNRLGDFVGFRFSAITPSGESLWPTYWPMETLEKKKQQIGSRAFATEYLNEPVSEEDQIFKSSWFSFFEAKDLDLANLEIVQACDPATGSHDLSSIITLGFDKTNGNFYVLDAYGKRESSQSFMQTVIDKYLFWKPKKIGWESVVFQKVYKEYLIKTAQDQGVHLPIVELSPKGVKKEVRISSLSPLIESGKLLIKKNQKELIEQLESFPKGQYDDVIDALEYAKSMFVKKKRKPLAFPVGRRPSEIKIKADEIIRSFRR